MAPPHPLYLAWLAEPVADGERRPRAPLHLTLVPPFAGDEGAVLAAARAATAGRAPVAVAATGTARFGPRRDVPVVLVAPDDGLRDLHEALMDALAGAGVDLGHARHVRAGFTPHVSLPRRDAGPPPIAPGEPLVVDHVALLRRGDGTVVAGRAPLARRGTPRR
ncbi:MAG: 2'-5' RNA ligase family protein [Thermoleophilia bacterium]